MEISFAKSSRSHRRNAGFAFILSLLLGGRVPAQPVTQPAVDPRAAGLEIQLYPGLTLTGTVGTIYQIQYFIDLSQTNNTSAWHCLEFLKLPASPYLWIDQSAPATGRRFYRAIAFSAPTNLVFIPPGTFRMGSPANEESSMGWEEPRTAVKISQGFWMGKYEVTQREYLSVMGSNPSYFSTNTDYMEDLSRPVESVSWFDAVNYCAALTERERLAGRISNNSLYRLPTEAEWEYACRAWTSTRFSFGDDPGYTNLTNYAWYEGNSGGTTHPVGQKLPNPWGLYDMHGNVWEYCQDWFGKLPGGIALDPQGPATGSFRVIRGGYYNFFAGGCRSAFRNDFDGTFAVGLFGFRVVLAAGQP